MKKTPKFSKKLPTIKNSMPNEDHPTTEQGITPTVKTIFSKITVQDIIDSITDIKANAILSWLKENKINPEKTLIIGIYLTGAKIANYLIKSSEVTVVDVYPHLQYFLKADISFKNSVFELDSLETFDFVLDTTGLGGLDPKEMGKINKPHAFLSENPTSDNSDSHILKVDQTLERLEYFDAPYSGYLFTEGLNSKTSGTMTLTMEVLRHSLEEVLQEEGVLYAVSSLDFYERIIFQEKDNEKYLKTINRPALVISSLKTVDCDQIIQNNINKIVSKVIKKL